MATSRVKTTTRERPAEAGRPVRAGLCVCGRRQDSDLAICGACIKNRQAECKRTRADKNFRSRNYACSYGWHQLILDCPLCIRWGVYGTTGCKPCDRCHFCNAVHIEPVAA